MDKVTIVFWSQSGNTESMANAVAEGVTTAGKEAVVVDVASASLDDLKAAKGFAFRFLVKPGDKGLKIAICVSCCMVIPMVIIMSLYGAFEVAISQGLWSQIGIIWLTNIPKNFVVALPLQLLVAGPLVRKVFRTVFPEGKVLA